MNKKELKNEFQDTKTELAQSFEDVSLDKSNIELTKQELKDMKERFKDLPDAMRERNIDIMRVDKKLRVIEQDMKIQDRLDQAIAFLEEMEQLIS